MSEAHLSQEQILKIVNDTYSAKAKECNDDSHSSAVAQAFGYTTKQLQSIPSESNMGLSCGNPVPAGNIKEGEIVLDLGSGGGIDVFLAASEVGPHGQVIGLDMSADMISLARKNAAKQNLHPPQVAFVQASLAEPLPIESGSVDCIISNCVINLLPSSAKVTLLTECARVLKSGGRIVLDDILAKRSLPDNICKDLVSYVACVSGAIQREEYEKILTDAGLSNFEIIKNPGKFSAFLPDGNETQANGSCGCCGSAPTVPSLPQNFDPDEWVESCQIRAVKLGVPGQTPSSVLLRWWDGYPVVQSSPSLITSDEVAAMLRDASKDDYAVIDVRRNDHADGHVRGSYQCPAQTFYDDLPQFYKRFGEKKRVIFYCGSSSGRGPRCAGWYQDYLNEKSVTPSQAFVLEGGIKAWLTKFGNDAALVDRD